MSIFSRIKRVFLGPSPLIKLMLNEHGTINQLLDDFEKSIGEDFALERFRALKEKISQHMYGEEKAIFVMYKKRRISNVVTILLKQHTKILDLVDSVESKIESKKDFSRELREFKQIHKVHIELEEENFYYKMDSVLDNYEKKEIVETYNAYILGSIHL
jgi:hypothetical protein